MPNGGDSILVFEGKKIEKREIDQGRAFLVEQ